MEYTISEELIESILGCTGGVLIDNCIYFDSYKLNSYNEDMVSLTEHNKFISADTFYFKCKDFLKTNMYSTEIITYNDMVRIEIFNQNNNSIVYSMKYYDVNEQQALFKSCEYILQLIKD